MRIVALAAGWTAAGLVAAACVGTGGAAIEVAFAFEALGEGGRALDAASPAVTLEDGTTITLSEASLENFVVYVVADDVATAWLERILPRAYAHGGHLTDASARAEWLDGSAVDLLHGRVALGRGGGTRGGSDGVRLLFIENGPHAHLRGTVTRIVDGAPTSATFAADLTLSAEPATRTVQGIPLVAALDRDGTVTMRMRVDRWLSWASFEGPLDGPRVLDAASADGFALSSGLRTARTYEARYDAPPSSP